MCWTEPLAVYELLKNYSPHLACCTGLLPNERAEQWHSLCCRVQTAKVQVFSLILSTSHTVYSAIPILTPGDTTVCILLTPPHKMLPSRSSISPKLFSLLYVTGSTHPLYLAFTALLASIPWLYLPLPLHFYLLMHFSTDPMCWYATRYYYPLYYSTWCMCLPCLQHPSMPKELLNKPTTWKGENNLIVHGQS